MAETITTKHEYLTWLHCTKREIRYNCTACANTLQKDIALCDFFSGKLRENTAPVGFPETVWYWEEKRSVGPEKKSGGKAGKAAAGRKKNNG